MDINLAKSSFKHILSSLSSNDRSQFLAWCEETFSETNSKQSYFNLRVIAEDIKTMVPIEAILPSENVDHSQIQDNSSGSCAPILHVDSFLFEEEHVDALEAEGIIKNLYCQNCRSDDIAPKDFISHSMSIKRIEYIFENILPDLTGKVFLDVGSRLGAALYGAYYYSSALRIIGVERNEDFCKLQKHIVDKYGLTDRIQIICNDICNVPDVIKSANVILFYNVFQCFLPMEMQHKIWIWLRSVITVPGTILITAPSMEETIGNLQTGIDISSWLRQVPVKNNCLNNTDDPDLLTDICCYVVI